MGEGLESSLRGGDVRNRGQTGSRGGSSTHSVGWAHRQRPLHASCAPHELGVGRQPGPPASLHRTSSQVHAAGLCVRGIATLSDDCCVPETDTHSHTHPWKCMHQASRPGSALPWLQTADQGAGMCQREITSVKPDTKPREHAQSSLLSSQCPPAVRK